MKTRPPSARSLEEIEKKGLALKLAQSYENMMVMSGFIEATGQDISPLMLQKGSPLDQQLAICYVKSGVVSNEQEAKDAVNSAREAVASALEANGLGKGGREDIYIN